MSRTLWIFVFLFAVSGLQPAIGNDDILNFVNQRAVPAADERYGERLQDAANDAARRLYAELSAMTMASFERTYLDSRLTDDGRFLLVFLWLRTHASVDGDFLRLVKTKHSQVCLNHHLMYQEDGFYNIGPNRSSAKIVLGADLEQDHIDFPSASEFGHVLVRIGPQSAAGRLESEWTWWYSDASIDNRSNLTFLRRLDRGWLIAPPK